MMTDFFPLFSRQSLKYWELILKLKTTKLRAAQRPFVCLGSPPPPSPKTDSLLRHWGASSHVSQRRLAEPHRGTKWQQISNKIHFFFFFFLLLKHFWSKTNIFFFHSCHFSILCSVPSPFREEQAQETVAGERAGFEESRRGAKQAASSRLGRLQVPAALSGTCTQLPRGEEGRGESLRKIRTPCVWTCPISSVLNFLFFLFHAVLCWLVKPAECQ